MLVPLRAGKLTRLFISILIGLMGTPFAHGACINAPDAGVRELQDLVGADPNQALARADTLLRSAAASNAAPADLAWIHMVRAQAFSALELDVDARAAVAEGIKLVPDASESVHVALATVDAENVYDAAGIATAIQSIEKIQSAGVAAPDTEICLLLTLGTLQYRHYNADQAIATLMQAYRSVDVAKNKEQHVLAADALSSVMREIGDYQQALILNTEVVEWRRARRESLGVSVAPNRRGHIYVDMREFAAAAAAFAEARALSVIIGDTLGVAFADMRICEVHIQLGEFVVARQPCNSALETFSKSKTRDLVKQTRSLMANIDLEQGNVAGALANLDEILADGAADMQPRLVPPLFKLRARANAARRNFPAAYADLEEYTKRFVETNEARRIRQIEGMRARFETDREIERSAGLQEDLERSRQRQTDLARLTKIAIAASALVIGLLTAMLWNARRHRRQLSALASADALTQLPNRRHTADLASRAIANAEVVARPLTLALIDLDHFKAINDEYGHAGGDHVLREFARLGRDVLRESDTFGRWGGEEFLLVMPDTTLDLALAIVERLRTRSREITLPGAKPGFRVSMSAGLASMGTGASSLDALVASADVALYRAKNEGRNMVQIDVLSVENASSGVRRVIARR